MTFTDKLAGTFESFLLVLFLVWSVGIAVTLPQPDVRPTPQGTVEIYSLVAADTQPA